MLLVIFLILSTSIIHAKKPDRPGGGGGVGGTDETPTGTIYFLDFQDYISMNADGTSKTTLPVAGYWGLPFEPSDATHGGGRWFLYTSGRSLAARKDDGTNVILVAPGDDGDWEAASDGKVRWVFDVEAAIAGDDGTDGLVSWYADRWIDGQIVDSAVCVAPVVFDASTGDVKDIDLTSVVRYYDTSWDFDWSPDGTEFVFSARTAPERGELAVYDALNDSVSPLNVGNGIDPTWSPDGASIAFADRSDRIDHIVTVQLDGLVETTLATARRRNPLEGTYLYRPSWSPHNTYLLYTMGNTKGYKEEYDVWRVTADGKQSVNLTNDIDSSFGTWILGWR